MLPASLWLTRVPTAGFDSLNYLSDMQSFGSPLYCTSDSTAQYNGLYLYQGPGGAIENVALAYATNQYKQHDVYISRMGLLMEQNSKRSVNE
jgi:hypothetical protein